MYEIESIFLNHAVYKTMIRLVVIYGSETWTLTKSDESFVKDFRRENTAEDLRADPRGGGISGELEIMN